MTDGLGTMMTDLPKTVRELRVQAATAGARAQHVLERVVTTTTPPLARPDVELMLIAASGSVHGFALAAVLAAVEEVDRALAELLLDMVNAIAGDGEDGGCADVWPDVERELAWGGVGTPLWDGGQFDAGVRAPAEQGV